LPNPDFLDNANGWILEEAFVASDGTGKSIVTISGDEKRVGKFSALSVSIRKFPVGRKLKFSFELLAHQEISQLLQIKAYSFDREDSVIDCWITQALAQDFRWTKFTATFYASPGAVRLNVWIQNAGDSRVSVRNPSLVPIDNPFTVYSVEAPPKCEEALSSVIEVNYSLDVIPSGSGKDGRICFPVPGLYRDQFPISFEIYSSPRSALQAYRLYLRDDRINWICEAEVRALGPVTLHWRAIVIVRTITRHRLEKTAILPPPPDIASWLSPTVCVQADDMGIRRKSMDLAEGAEDVELFVRRVLRFVHGNNGKEGEVFDSLDAKRALECGGSCTSRANLTAALLRSNGVAARTVVHIPIWGRWMDSHWLVEYWHPGEGWIWLEPSLNQLEPSPNSLIILSVAGTDDENKSLEPDNLKNIMPGAAYLSVPLLSPELERGWGYGTNFAIELAKLEGSCDELTSLFAEATKEFELISNSNLRTSKATRPTRGLLSAICSGSADKLRTALRGRLQ
jgi:hypothetical protein